MKQPLNTLVMARFRPDRPHGGSALRNWQNICALSELGAVDVISLGTEEAAESVAGVRSWKPFPLARRSIVDRAYAKAWPLLVAAHPSLGAYRHHEVIAWIRSEVPRLRYDVAVIEELSLAEYADELKAAGCRHLVFDAHNVEGILRAEMALRVADSAWPSVSRGARLLRRHRLVAAERRVLLAADVVWSCSEHDAREIVRVYGTKPRVTVVPNGVHVAAYENPRAMPLERDWEDRPVTLVFMGTYSYLPNEEAALRLVREVLPVVRARGRHAKVVLVGRDPTAAMRAVAGEDPDVTVTGAVESVIPYLEGPCVVALPISLGSGTRLKILESFAMSRPVVSTHKGAEGIDAEDGRHLLLRESAAEIAQAAIDLWEQPALRQRLCRDALELVRRAYSWDTASQRIRASLDTRRVLDA